MTGRILIAVLIVLTAYTSAFTRTMEPPRKPAPPKPLNLEDLFLEASVRLKPDAGPCKGDLERYYYDMRVQRYRSFFWGGCQGVVPFRTMEECEDATALHKPGLDRQR